MTHRLFSSFYDFFSCGTWYTELDIIFNRILKEIYILEYHSDMTHQMGQGILFDVLAVH